ncbi:MAG: twin transmembrane helix small protein [Alphaproteobacteria bacterium]|jgi:hypothetical protein
MKDLMPWLISVAALTVFMVLVVGILNMFRDPQNPKRANVLMCWRVGLQAGAVGLFVLYLIFFGR